MFYRTILLFTICSKFLQAEITDRILAIVNQEPILASDVTKNKTLETLIDEQLIYQEAKKLALYPSEHDLEQTIQSVIKQNKLTLTTFETALKAQNLTLPEYRNQLRKQMIKMRLIQNKVKSRVANTLKTQVKLEAEQAIFATLEGAEEALRTKNIPFQNMGNISKEDLLPSFATEVFLLKEGQISKPLKSPQGFHLVRVRKRIEIPLEKVDKQRYEQELENAFQRYVAELRANAYIERK